eukprot:g41882.t1
MKQSNDQRDQKSDLYGRWNGKPGTDIRLLCSTGRYRLKGPSNECYSVICPGRKMSGFSPELIDYLEGKISFEEFERLREERKAIERTERDGRGICLPLEVAEIVANDSLDVDADGMEAIGDGVTEDEAEITAVEDRDGPPRASHSRTKQKPNDL